MKSILARANYYTTLLGVDVRRGVRTVRFLPRYLIDLARLRGQARHASGEFQFGALYPCLGEASASGAGRGHYFHQDLLVARRIAENAPRRHVDVGSRIDGFVAHVAAFRQIDVVDLREPPGPIPNVRFFRADLMDAGSLGDAGLLGDAGPLGDLRCDSLSCLHALEHFGLGRYGDRIDYHGHRLGLANLAALLEPGGRLYLSVPIGPQRIEFNAHRVFAVSYLLEILSPDFEVERFSFVDDDGDLHESVALDPGEIDRNFGCWYGCGIFESKRRPP